MTIYAQQKKRSKLALFSLVLVVVSGVAWVLCIIFLKSDQVISDRKTSWPISIESTKVQSTEVDVGRSGVDRKVAIAKRSLVPDIKDCGNNLTNHSTSPVSNEITFALQDERERIAKYLISSNNETDRAAGIYFRVRSQSYIAYKDCVGEGCSSAVTEEKFRAENERFIADLVGIASTTKSAKIYAWALNACSSERIRYSKENSCATLSRQKTVALEPNNGWGWLALAAEANGQGNESSRGEALFKAANSNEWSPPSGELTALLVGNISRESDPLVILGLLNDAKSVSSEMRLSGLHTMATLCPAEADQNRKQICRTLADKVIASSNDILGISIGLKVGERSGIPEDRLKARRDEYAALVSVMPASSMLKAEDRAASCRNSIPVIRYLENSILNGEVSALQDIVRLDLKK